MRAPLRYMYNKIIIALLKDLDNLIQLAYLSSFHR